MEMHPSVTRSRHEAIAYVALSIRGLESVVLRCFDPITEKDTPMLFHQGSHESSINRYVVEMRASPFFAFGHFQHSDHSTIENSLVPFRLCFTNADTFICQPGVARKTKTKRLLLLVRPWLSKKHTEAAVEAGSH
jgi:hypothetical protein